MSGAKYFEVSGYEALSDGFAVSDSFRLRLTGVKRGLSGLSYEGAELVSGFIRATDGEAVSQLYFRTRWEGRLDGGIVLYSLSDRRGVADIGWFVGQLVEP